MITTQEWDMVTFEIIDFLRTLATDHAIILAERFEKALDEYEAAAHIRTLSPSVPSERDDYPLATPRPWHAHDTSIHAEYSRDGVLHHHWVASTENEGSRCLSVETQAANAALIVAAVNAYCTTPAEPDATSDALSAPPEPSVPTQQDTLALLNEVWMLVVDCIEGDNHDDYAHEVVRKIYDRIGERVYGTAGEAPPEQTREPSVPTQDEVEKGDVLVAIEKALDMVDRLNRPRGTAGAREWLMSIPARPDYDPDLVISEALTKASRFIAHIRTLSPATDEINQAALTGPEPRGGV